MTKEEEEEEEENEIDRGDMKRNEEEEGSVCSLGVSPCVSCSLRGVMSSARLSQ